MGQDGGAAIAHAAEDADVHICTAACYLTAILSGDYNPATLIIDVERLRRAASSSA